MVGQPGEPGAAVLKPVVVEHKHACALAPVLLRETVVLIVKEVARNLSLVIAIHVQVGYNEDPSPSIYSID